MTLTGVLMLVYSIKLLVNANCVNALAVFNLENGNHPFSIESSGYYSICILGAGHIFEQKKVSIELVSNETKSIHIRHTIPAIRFRKDGKIGIEYWGFSISEVGTCVLTINGLEGLEAKESMLSAKRLFESPIELAKLKMLISRSAHPLVKVISIIATVFGGILFVFGVTIMLNQNF